MQWFRNFFQYFCIKGTLKQFKDNVIVDWGTCFYKSNHCSNVLDELFCITTDIYFLYIIITTRTNWKKAFGLCLKYLLYFIHSFLGDYWALIVDFFWETMTVSGHLRDHHENTHFGHCWNEFDHELYLIRRSWHRQNRKFSNTFSQPFCIIIIK